MTSALLAAGCIVADPPNSSDPQKTPPVLLLAEADPPVHLVKPLSRSSGSQVLINVPVRSEDAGDELYALLYKDWNVAGQLSSYIQRATVRLAPSTFDDTGRMISTAWDYEDASRGCTQLTLMVTHASNFNVVTGYTNPADIAIATWFFNIDDDDDPRGTNTLSTCPSFTRTRQ